MINPKVIAVDLARLQTFKMIMETYETIAASSMRRIRHSVLQNREYHLGLNKLFQEAKRAYEGEMRELMERKKISGIAGLSLIKRNARTAYLLLSANTGLYGDIINRTFFFFLERLRQGNADAAIVGRAGEAMLEAVSPATPRLYFEFPDTHIAPKNLKIITQHLSQYEKVVVFYGEFKSILTQSPTATNISGDIYLAGDGGDLGARYIFEPSLETIAIFFETEIFASLLEGTFHESRLAKLASRLVLLDRATSNIDNEFRRVWSERGKLRHRLANKKQLDAVSGISLWGR